MWVLLEVLFLLFIGHIILACPRELELRKVLTDVGLMLRTTPIRIATIAALVGSMEVEAVPHEMQHVVSFVMYEIDYFESFIHFPPQRHPHFVHHDTEDHRKADNNVYEHDHLAQKWLNYAEVPHKGKTNVEAEED